MLVLGVDGQAREARGGGQKQQNWQGEPQSALRSPLVLHGQVALHLRLVHSVQAQVCEASTDDEGEVSVPHCWVRVDTVGHRVVRN